MTVKILDIIAVIAIIISLLMINKARAQEANLDLSFDASAFLTEYPAGHCETDLYDETDNTSSVFNKPVCPIALRESSDEKVNDLNKIVEAVVTNETVVKARTTVMSIARPRVNFDRGNGTIKVKVDPRKDEIVKITLEWKTD